MRCIVQAQECPYCGNLARFSKGYGKTRTIKECKSGGYHLVYKFIPKRLNCSCGKSFTAKAKDLPSRNRLTVPLRMSIINDLAEYMTIKTIASKNNVSEYLVNTNINKKRSVSFN